MQRTFTLRRLFLNVTVLCVITAISVAFPKALVRLSLAVGLFLPTITVCTAFAYVSGRKKIVFGISLTGGLVAWLLTPRIYVSWNGLPSWWDLYVLDFQTQAIPAAIGALCFGGIAWMCGGRSPRLSHGPAKTLSRRANGESDGRMAVCSTPPRSTLCVTTAATTNVQDAEEPKDAGERG